MSTETQNGSQETPRVLYCNCTYAKVVPAAVKDEVLRQLGDSGIAFDAVPDLCEMSARKDPALARLAGSGKLKIAACFPRAVKWLFHGAGTPLDDGVEILNMREQSAEEIVSNLLALSPSLNGSASAGEAAP